MTNAASLSAALALCVTFGLAELIACPFCEAHETKQPTQAFTFKPDHIDAAKLAEILGELLPHAAESVTRDKEEVVVTGHPAFIEFVNKLVKQIDVQQQPTRQTIIVKLKHADADETSSVVSEVFSELKPTPQSEVIVVPEIVTQSLIVSCPEGKAENVKRLIEVLDAAAKQPRQAAGSRDPNPLPIIPGLQRSEVPEIGNGPADEFGIAYMHPKGGVVRMNAFIQRGERLAPGDFVDVYEIPKHDGQDSVPAVPSARGNVYHMTRKDEHNADVWLLFTSDDATRMSRLGPNLVHLNLVPPFEAKLLLVNPYWGEEMTGEQVKAMGNELRDSLQDAAIPNDLLKQLPDTAMETLFPTRTISLYKPEHYADLLAWLKKQKLVIDEVPFPAAVSALGPAPLGIPGEGDEATAAASNNDGPHHLDSRSELLKAQGFGVKEVQGAGRGIIKPQDYNFATSFVRPPDFFFPKDKADSYFDFELAPQPYITEQPFIIWSIVQRRIGERIRFLFARQAYMEHTKRGQPAHMHRQQDVTQFGCIIPNGHVAIMNAFPADDNCGYVSGCLDKRAIPLIVTLPTTLTKPTAEAKPQVHPPDVIETIEPEYQNLRRQLRRGGIGSFPGRADFGVLGSGDGTPVETFTIEGAVELPGSYDFVDGLRVIDAILRAGGLSAEAGETGMIVREEEASPINIDILRAARVEHANLLIAPGDVVTIEKRNDQYQRHDVLDNLLGSRTEMLLRDARLSPERIKELRQGYEAYESNAQSVAKKIHIALQGDIDAGTLDTLKKQLHDQVTQAFHARHKFHLAKLAAMQQELGQALESLERRSQIEEEIVDRRVNELLEGAPEPNKAERR